VNSRLLGALLAVGSTAVAAAYVYLLTTDAWQLVVRATLAAAVLVLAAAAAWIGYSIATAPPPKPIEEIEREIEEELRRAQGVEGEGGDTGGGQG